MCCSVIDESLWHLQHSTVILKNKQQLRKYNFGEEGMRPIIVTLLCITPCQCNITTDNPKVRNHVAFKYI